MKSNQAFTLIELLVVVLIIGILAAVALPQYTRAVDKTRYTQVMTLGEKILQAQERYRMEHGSYTLALSELDMDMPTPIKVTGDASIGETYYYDWGHCTIHDTGYVQCTLKIASGGVWYFSYPGSKSRQCWAYQANNTRAQELCKAVTGKTDIVPSGFYTQYTF